MKKLLLTTVTCMICYCMSAQITVYKPDPKTPIFEKINDTFAWKYGKKRTNLKFEIRIAEDEKFQENLKVFNVAGESGNNYLNMAIPYLKAGMTYYWDIRAIYNDKKTNELIFDPWYSADELKGKVMKIDVLETAQDTDMTLDETRKSMKNYLSFHGMEIA